MDSVASAGGVFRRSIPGRTHEIPSSPLVFPSLSSLPPSSHFPSRQVQFLVSPAGRLALGRGAKRSALLGFCDPCPGERKQLWVRFALQGDDSEVREATFGDGEEVELGPAAPQCGPRL